MGMADEGGLLFDKLQRRDPADEWSRPPPKPNRDRKVSEQKGIFPCGNSVSFHHEFSIIVLYRLEFQMRQFCRADLPDARQRSAARDRALIRSLGVGNLPHE